MVSITITFNGDKEIPMDEYKEVEDGRSCPLPTQDADMNEENKMVAAEDADYRDSADDGGFVATEVCGNCGAYNQTEDMLECIGDESGDLGYCQIYKFVCEASYTCNDWVDGGPIKSLAQEDYRETF
jgi:hypothetical protein